MGKKKIIFQNVMDLLGKTKKSMALPAGGMKSWKSFVVRNINPYYNNYMVGE